MKIVADADILFVKEAFSAFGEVVAVPAAKITGELLKDAAILLVRSVTTVDEALLAGTAVEFVATATIGTDHVDREYLDNNAIGFAAAPGSNANAVSEYVTAALLRLAEIKNIDLENCTIGIIGVGNTGGRVLQKARALGLRCLLNDPPKQRIMSGSIYISLEELLAQSDIVTLHVPLTMTGPDATFRMVNERFLDAMKTGALLINTSRGGVVDEKALCANARQKLGGLAIDVWDGEPEINGALLEAADIATPHIAGYSCDGKIRGTGGIHDAACAFFFKKSAWSMQKQLDALQSLPFDCARSQRPVPDAVEKAYSIEADSRRLKKICALPGAQKAAFFRELRRDYPRRLEFCHYTVHGNFLNDKDRSTLAGLGFCLRG